MVMVFITLQQHYPGPTIFIYTINKNIYVHDENSSFRQVVLVIDKPICIQTQDSDMQYQLSQLCFYFGGYRTTWDINWTWNFIFALTVLSQNYGFSPSLLLNFLFAVSEMIKG